MLESYAFLGTDQKGDIDFELRSKKRENVDKLRHLADAKNGQINNSQAYIYIYML